MIDEAAAVERARARAAEKGWAFMEPVRVTTRRTWLRGTPMRYEIVTNDGQRGAIARFVVDASSGAILDEGYVPL